MKTDSKQESFLSGMEKSMEQAKLETARRMLVLGMAEDVIRQVTGFPGAG